MNQSSPSSEDKEKLWAYVQGNFKEACKSFVQPGTSSGRARQVLDTTFRLLSLVVTTYQLDDFASRLLKGFLQIDLRIFNDLDLNMILMEKRIISLAEWDKQIANHFKAEGASLSQQELKFFASILETGIVGRKIFTKEQVPQLIAVIQGMTQDSKIGKQCQFILDSLDGNKQSESNNGKFRELFIKWVVISYLDGGQDQEAQVNAFFSELKALGIDSEPLLFNFCKVMVRTSVERALVYGDESGEKRPADRLDFRYIDSFVKLVVVWLSMFNLNKHDFLTKIFEFIGEALDEEHRIKKADFNQRPYYRMLMNLLTAIGHPAYFNSKAQLSILHLAAS